ncbi:MAG TPA: Ig-like domain-containing protein [Caulobacteraceae bacterium]|jgi:hypothetical protein|nr:Ig-like domain-containing protein [Caulobacteraceae bacterium]
MFERLGGMTALLAAGAALAQSPPPAAPGAAPPGKVVSEVVVPGGPQPKVASSFPAEGATVSAGELALKVIFDQPMTASKWAYAPSAAGSFPVCLDRPRLLADGKTFLLLCQVKPNTAYAIALGPAPGFEGAAGRDLAPTVLKFSTNDQIVDDLHDALDEAGLKDSDDPIMTWNDDGKTPPTSAPPSS